MSLETTWRYAFGTLARDILVYGMPRVAIWKNRRDSVGTGLEGFLSAGCCQNPCHPNACTISTTGPHESKPKPSRAASGANPSGWLTCRGGNKSTVGIKAQLKARGSVAKEEDPKRSHRLCKLQIKSILSTRQTVCGINKRSLRAPTQKNSLVLKLWTSEARTHRSRSRLESELPP